MAYPPGHREKSRRKIVQSARRLFNRRGFENVSINEIMADAGLTRGGFYSYFTSKSELYVEALSCFFTDPTWKCTWKGVEIDLDAALVAPQIVRAYLSRQHFENIEESCPMVALPSDVARGDRKTKEAFEGVFRAMVRFIEKDVATTARMRQLWPMPSRRCASGGWSSPALWTTADLRTSSVTPARRLH